jgi:hypothetical protein
MSRTALHRFASVALGILLAGALYWFDVAVLLVVAVGLALTASVGLTLRVAREFPGRRTGEGWQDGRWTAVSIGVANTGALVGVQAISLRAGPGRQ